jgi:Tubulin-tyrosine ligase family
MRVRSILTLILIVNVIILIFFLFRSESVYDQTRKYSYRPLAPHPHGTFKNPGTAFMIYTQLDNPASIETEYYNRRDPHRNSFFVPHLKLFRDDGYCKRVKKFVTHLPESIFNESGIFTDFSWDGRFRSEVVPLIGEDMMPEVTYYKSEDDSNNDREYYLRRGIINFYTDEPLHDFQDLGKDFACSSQAYNHIPGNGGLFRNDYFAENYIRYFRRYSKADALACFTFETFYPEIWNLDDPEDCDHFFKSELIRPIREKLPYVKKFASPIHIGEVDIVLQEDEEKLKELYAGGDKCGNVTNGNMIQRFVNDPLLIDGHKFELRAYLLIASTNPYIVYYHDGFIRRSLFKYNDLKPDVRSLFPNIKINKELLHEVLEAHNDLTEDQIREFRIWDYDQLGDYLFQNNITGSNWVSEFLRPYLKSALVHIVRAVRDDLLQSSQVYELVGVDFIFDQTFNLWFMEANMRALFFGAREEIIKQHKQMLMDMFDITIALTRSRVKRIFKLIAEIEEGFSKNQLRGFSNDVKEEKIMEYKKVERNSFEPEYSPRANNKFELIIDENRADDPFIGLLKPECIA